MFFYFICKSLTIETVALDYLHHFIYYLFRFCPKLYTMCQIISKGAFLFLCTFHTSQYEFLRNKSSKHMCMKIYFDKNKLKYREIRMLL